MELDKRTIGRTITTTQCNGQRVVNGEFTDYFRVLTGEYDVKRATTKLRKMENDETIVINNCEIIRNFYGMSLKTFVEIAKKKGFVKNV